MIAKKKKKSRYSRKAAPLRMSGSGNKSSPHYVFVAFGVVVVVFGDSIVLVRTDIVSGSPEELFDYDGESKCPRSQPDLHS